MAFRSDVPDYTKELTIIINEEDPQTTAKFTVTEELLVRHSEFFSAPSRDTSGSAATVIKVPQVDPDTFRAYLYWIHVAKIAFETDYKWDALSGADLYPASLALAKLWLLAHRLATPKLCYIVISRVRRLFISLDRNQGDLNEMFPASMTMFLWPATNPGGPLRDVIVDYYARYVPIHLVEQHMEEYHPDFIQDLMQKIVDIHQNPDPNLIVKPQMTNGHNAEGATPNPSLPFNAAAQPADPPWGFALTLTDQDGKIIQTGIPFAATPQQYFEVAYRKLFEVPLTLDGPEDELSLHIMDGTSQTIPKDQWLETIEKILAGSGHIGKQGNLAIKFGRVSFPSRCFPDINGDVELQDDEL